MKFEQISAKSDWRQPAALPLAAAVWAVPFLFYVTHDYDRWMLPWWRHIVSTGRIASFSAPFANYTPPYLYLLSVTTLLDGAMSPLIAIKLLGTLGALWLCWSVYRLTRCLDAAAMAPLLPTVIVNVPLLAQADAFYAAPCVFAVAAAVRKDMLWMVAWAGIGFAFKAQAIFIAPFVAAVLISNRAPWWLWPLPVAIYAAFMLPAWLAGWPASDLATVYLHQAQWVQDDGSIFVSNAANWWVLFRFINNDLAARSFWIGYVLAVIASVAFVWRFRTKEIVPAAAISALMLPWLLPGMHERFFFLGEILAYCHAFMVRTRNAIYAAVLLQFALVLSVAGWKSETMLAAAGCPLVLAAMLLLSDRKPTVCRP